MSENQDEDDLGRRVFQTQDFWDVVTQLLSGPSHVATAVLNRQAVNNYIRDQGLTTKLNEVKCCTI